MKLCTVYAYCAAIGRYDERSSHSKLDNTLVVEKSVYFNYFQAVKSSSYVKQDPKSTVSNSGSVRNYLYIDCSISKTLLICS